MDKPLTVARQEYINALAELTNNSHLPFFIVEDVLKTLIQEVHKASVEQYNKDLQIYNEEKEKENNG